MWLKRTLGGYYPCLVCGEKFPLESPAQKLCGDVCKIARLREQDAAAKRRSYPTRDKEKCNEKSLRYYWRNREKCLIANKKAARKHYVNNREKVKASQKERYKRKKEQAQ